MKLIHVALFIEAKPLIEYFNLKQYDTKPFKIFKNDSIVLIVSGIGKENTQNALSLIFKKYDITQAYNIGTAGCGDRTIKLYSLLCTNRDDLSMDYIPCETVINPQSLCTNERKLYDMEAEFFLQKCQDLVDEDKIYILKIVSDYCDDSVFKKEIVYNMVKKNINKIAEVINASK